MGDHPTKTAGLDLTGIFDPASLPALKWFHYVVRDSGSEIFEICRRFTKRFGPDTAEISQLLYGRGPVEFCHGLDDAKGVFCGKKSTIT